MAVNYKSGRVVIEIEPHLKLALHAALAADGISLKEWVVRQALDYLDGHVQPQLSLVAEPPNPPYGTVR